MIPLAMTTEKEPISCIDVSSEDSDTPNMFIFGPGFKDALKEKEQSFHELGRAEEIMLENLLVRAEEPLRPGLCWGFAATFAGQLVAAPEQERRKSLTGTSLKPESRACVLYGLGGGGGRTGGDAFEWKMCSAVKERKSLQRAPFAASSLKR
ncbi:hypothetical protein AV530_001569 [Patagioenas fasciata monilis]|uniref:Uncharacterized protein n=1 Tax=Patagioenas fasciata monilis TaxID=372326 RepID=A0A1V4KR85_PATFA|nr:hypothetical protein AV530_001569 [Patagioenas fasciata monilis]